MKPYFEIDSVSNKMILELYKKCKEIDLGNVSFTLFQGSKYNTDVNFYITQYKTYWELVVKHDQPRPLMNRTYPVHYAVTDIYKIYDDEEIQYEYSEKDLV